MDNKKFKKLLVATLAASSTFAAFDAMAEDYVTNPAGNTAINAGVASANLNKRTGAIPDVAGTTPYVFVARGTNTIASNDAARQLGVTFNLLGNAGAEYTTVGDIDGSAANNLVIVNDFSDAMLIRAGYGNAAGAAVANDAAALTAGKALAAAAPAANATLNLKIDANNRQVVKLSLDTIARIGQVDFDTKTGAKFAINFGADKREDVTDAANSTINTKFIRAGANTVVEVNAEGKWVSFKNDASTTNIQVTAGNVLLNETSTRNVTVGEKGTLYVLEGKTLTGTVDGAAAKKGTLVLEGGNVTGNVGGALAATGAGAASATRLALVKHTGKTSTLTGTLNAERLDLSGDEKLVVIGTIANDTKIVAVKDKAVLEHNVAAPAAAVALRDIELADGVTTVTQSINATPAAANQVFTVADDIKNSILNFADTNGSVIEFAAGKGTAKAITTDNDGEGIVRYAGEAVISANIGTKEKAVDTVNLANVANKHGTVKSGASVYGDIEFNVADQKLTVEGGALVSDVLNNAGVNGTTIVAQAGASVGNVGVNVNALQFTGGGNLIGQEYGAKSTILDGGVYKLDNGGKIAGIANLITKNNVTLDANGSKLVFAPGTVAALGYAADNTKIADGTTLKLVHGDDALEVTGLTKDNVGRTTVILNSDKFFDDNDKLTVNQLLTKGAEVKLIKGVATEDLANQFVFGGKLKHETKYENNYVNVYTSADEGFVFSFFDAESTARDKALGFEARAALKYAHDVNSNVEDVKAKGAVAQDESQNSAVAQNLIDVAVNKLDAFDNPASDAAAAPAAGDADYNEMGVRAFVTPFMAKGHAKANGNVVASDIDLAGATFGATVGVNEDNTHIGLALTLANSTSKLKDQKDGDKLKGETKAVSLFANQVLGNNFVLQGVLSLGVTDYKNTHRGFSGLEYTGKYTSKFASLLAKVGYNLNAGSNFKVMPYVGLRYDGFRNDSYSLANGNTKLAVDSQDTNRYLASIGTKFTGSMDMDSAHLAPFADVSFGYNFGKKASVKKLDLGNAAVSAEYASNDKTLVSANVGLEAQMQGGVNVALGGGMSMLGNKTTVYNGSLKLGYRF